MATPKAPKSIVEKAAKVGSPAGTLNVPRGTNVPPATQSKGRATQRAVAATAPVRPKVGRTVNEAFNVYAAGPPEELLSERQFRRGELEQAEQSYYGMEPFKPQQFTEQRPAFDAQAVSRMMPNLLVMMSLGGRATRINALGMMKAMSAGLKGFQEGNQDAYKQALFDYEQNYRQFAEREKVRREQYDFMRNAAKDGLELAMRRSERADTAVGDYNAEARSNIGLAATVEQNRREALEAGARILAQRAKATVAAAPTAGAPIDEKTRIKREELYGRASTTVESNVRSLLEQVNAVDRLMAHPGLQDLTGRFLGMGDGAVGSFLSEDAADAKTIYDFILSKGTFASLADIRAASTTGGALGNVSDKDIALLKGSVGAIGTRQRASSLEENLKNYRRNLLYVIGKSVDAFNKDYGYAPSKVIDRNRLEADLAATLPPVPQPAEPTPTRSAPTMMLPQNFGMPGSAPPPSNRRQVGRFIITEG